eukprot:s1299_g17.t1
MRFAPQRRALLQQLNPKSVVTTGQGGHQDAVLSASVARAAAAAQAARAQVASGHAAAGGCAPHAIGGESIVFDIPLHLADKVLGDGSWQKSVQQKTGARVIVRRDALKCQLELCGQPEQVVDAESFCEETVRVIAAGMPPPLVPEKPPTESLLALPIPHFKATRKEKTTCTNFNFQVAELKLKELKATKENED